MIASSHDIDAERIGLEDRVRKAFPADLVPQTADIVPASKQMNLERDQIGAFLSGKRWDSLTFDSLAKDYKGDESAMLNFLSLQGFAYYYPAFLLITLNNFSSLGRQSVCSSYYAFMPSDDKDLARTKEMKIRQLSAAQLDVVAEVLEFVAQHDADTLDAEDIRSAIWEIRRVSSKRL